MSGQDPVHQLLSLTRLAPIISPRVRIASRGLCFDGLLRQANWLR